jgi:acetylornithine deacetylase/succinyl-diaminopimelate desuccinylase-like protein
VGLRGMVYVQIDVTGPALDLHSGGYGGLVENPANALAQIIAALKDRDGVVQVPGFYDDVVPITDQQRSELAAMPFDDGEILRITGSPMLVGEKGYEPLERTGYRPTLDVNGMWSGFTGEGSKTIIPGHAHAKVSCRLVSNQDPERILESLGDYIRQVAPPGVSVDVRELGRGKPLVVGTDDPVAQAALEALEATFGVKPFTQRGGGSIPVAEMFETVLGHAPVMLGFANPDSNAHAPNESMVLSNYETGLRTICRLWDNLGGRTA